MTEHISHIGWDGTNISYDNQIVVFQHDKIQWQLDDTSAGKTASKLKIIFDKGDNSPTGQQEYDQQPGQPTSQGGLDHPYGNKSNYKYSIYVILKNKQKKSVDPEIIFKDYPLEIKSLRAADLGLLDDALDRLGTKAQAAFKGLLTDLDAAKKQPQRDPNAFFYPGGINNISVEVEALDVTVSITVSGPEASALIPSTQSKGTKK
jgi:hypothetical protein